MTRDARHEPARAARRLAPGRPRRPAPGRCSRAAAPRPPEARPPARRAPSCRLVTLQGVRELGVHDLVDEQAAPPLRHGLSALLRQPPEPASSTSPASAARRSRSSRFQERSHGLAESTHLAVESGQPEQRDGVLARRNGGGCGSRHCSSSRRHGAAAKAWRRRFCSPAALGGTQEPLAGGTTRHGPVAEGIDDRFGQRRFAATACPLRDGGDGRARAPRRPATGRGEREPWEGVEQSLSAAPEMVICGVKRARRALDLVREPSARSVSRRTAPPHQDPRRPTSGPGRGRPAASVP